MQLHTSLVPTIVVGIVLAFAFGAIAHRLKASPLVGYLLAGVVIGPFTPGFVAEQTSPAQLAEIGVILLMFGVGLHFSLAICCRCARSRCPAPSCRSRSRPRSASGVADCWAGIGAGAGVRPRAVGREHGRAAARARGSRGVLETERGRIAVGWLVVEDLAMVLVLVLLPALRRCSAARAAHGRRHRGGGDCTLAHHTRQGRGVRRADARRRPPRHSRGCSALRRAHRLARAVHARRAGVALGVAFGAAALFGVSFALGAFFAGMVVSESELSQRAAEERCRCATLSPCCSSSRSGCCSTRPCYIDAAACRARDGRCSSWSASRSPPSLIVLAVPLPADDRPDDRGEPRADRRVLVHPRRARRCARTAAAAAATLSSPAH